MTWPALRQEIDLFEGPTLSKGQPSWVLHDPVRHQFFRIDWLTFEILRRWSLNDAQAIIRSIEQDTPLEVSQDDLDTTAKFLTENQLISSTGDSAIHNMAKRRHALRQRWWQWLIHHYLFFRLPLCRPDVWLGRTRKLTEPFFSRSFITLSLGALGFGLYQLSQQWDRFHSFLLDTLTLQGLAAYCAALFVSKFLHELGHAYALKRQGGRVPTMGIAFLVLWPMAYTDTNEAWKVADRKKDCKSLLLALSRRL